MRRFGWVALALVLLMLAGVPAALAEKRIALLIGNEAYTTEVGRLSNPHNDIALLEGVLKRLGFDVTIVRDAGLASLHQAVNTHVRRVRQSGPDTVGFFYYSGHGAADGATNYLIPVDVKTIDDDQLWDQSLRLTEITRKLKDEAGNATHFVVFDACRNTLKLRRTGTKAIVQSKGFVPVGQESGMLVAYATAEGALASDVGTGAGPYATVLADEVVKPGIEAVAMFRNVQRRVRTAIGQEPYLGFNALGDIYFAGQAPPSGGSTITDAAREWGQVDKTSIAELETFLQRHGSSAEADYARARLAPLKKQQADLAQQAAGAAKQKAEDEVRAKADAERQRLAMLEQLAAEARNKKKLDDEARAKPEADRQRLAMLEQLAAEAIQKQAGVRDDATPGRVFRDCSECPEMVVVPAGSFTMGSPTGEVGRSDNEGPQHEVAIAKPLAVARFAVTRGEYAAFVREASHAMGDKCWTYEGRWEERSGKSFRNPGFTQDDRHPVVCVNWDDANAYAAWLSKKTGKTYRLLSESEREYVTRAGTTTPFWWGSSIPTAQANYDGNYTYGGGSKGEYLKRTVPVDSFEPNPWGLYNVHGNVWEWTEDCWNDSNTGNPGDGRARIAGDCNRRVVRGGSWFDFSRSLRSAYRLGLTTDYRSYSQGFRVARSLNP
jgi:formylglycine-generating enzyme required for sulfatase activity